jgi:hypothetical protein
VVIEATTFDANSATVSAQTSAYGSAIYLLANNAYAPLRITGSSITNNTLSSGGGNAGQSAVALVTRTLVDLHPWDVEIVNSTIGGNTKGSIYTEAYLATSLKVRSSTIDGVGVADDTVARFANSVVGAVGCAGFDLMTISEAGAGYNVFGFLGGMGGCAADGTDTVLGASPTWGALANNGGPTLTRALPGGSALIDAANPGGCTDTDLSTVLTVDQRDLPRDDGSCDIGAFEVQ